MFKKVSCILLAALMVFTISACRGAEPSAPAAPAPAAPAAPAAAAPAAPEAPAAPADDWKIGIITGTVTQNEEEFQAAQKMVRVLGADRVITATYPDRFNDEVETTISQVMALADQGAKAIVFVQAVPGTIAAINKTREKHPDMLFITGVVAEAPREVAAVADINLLMDEISMGTAVIEQAKKQGAEVFIHYSFPRHLGYETIAIRRELFIQNCERLGIEFVDVTAPDPTGDAGMSGAQQFIIEDVPRQIARYGKNTAMFSTNCGMQEPLIRSVLEQQAIYPQPCDASPFHGFPAALNISMDGREGDVAYVIEQTRLKVAEGGNTGRMSNWPVPVAMLMIEAGADYAMRYAKGEITERFNRAELDKSIEKVANEYNAEVILSKYSDDQGELDNFLLILSEYVDY